MSGDRRVVVEVPESLAGERIDRVVAMVTDVSRTEAARLVSEGAVTIDGVVATRGADRLTGAVEIAVDLDETAAVELPQADASIEVPTVHVDEHVIVIDKPADLVIHPGAGHLSGTLVNGLLARYPEMASVGDPLRPGVVHRLDRGTSGLLMVARTQVAYQSLVEQLAARSVDRQYRTLVWGHPESPRGLVDAPIGRSPKHPTKMAVTERGKPARTRYEVETLFTEPVVVAELVCRLETGRTHQIRVHLSAIGHSVVGDDRYRGARESLPCPRPYLHAERLGFDHPVSGERLEFESAVPDDLLAIRARLS
ncbi:RluA family pseudouridine synthase [Aquihabitans sp. McL0605]|uniref:RluA family pseudouridine synthase n=1 Tax=Aquihabitans sp. McL0605 TaxID=3415671 RepID=UPI003CF11EC2